MQKRVLFLGGFLNIFLYVGVLYGLLLDLTIGHFHWFRSCLWRTWLVHFFFLFLCGWGVSYVGAFLLSSSFYMYLSVMFYFFLCLVVLLNGGYKKSELIMKGDQEVAFVETRGCFFSTVNCITFLSHDKKLYYEVLSDELTGLKVVDYLDGKLIVSFYSYRSFSDLDEVLVEIDCSDKPLCRVLKRCSVDYEINPCTYLSLFQRGDGLTVEKVA